jgi:hypothetical protein
MIYICGDSFGVPDPTYGAGWMDQIGATTNLCQVSASNLLIAQQVDRAIAAGAERIIVLFTSSTRSEKVVNGQAIPFSWHTANTTTTPFSTNQLRILQEYFAEFHDLGLAIYTNQCIIQHTLGCLQQSGVDYTWDQGGFEHVSMGGRPYFTEYNSTRSDLCLWDYATTRQYRPYYHITDARAHEQIATYYKERFQ